MYMDVFNTKIFSGHIKDWREYWEINYNTDDEMIFKSKQKYYHEEDNMMI